MERYKLTIYEDECPQSPREWDNLGTIYYKEGSRYRLGDFPATPEEMERITSSGDYYWLPVYAYIHSGITVNTTGFNCLWDSGQCGIISVLKDDSRIEGMSEDKILSILEGEIETFDAYLRGDVWCWRIDELCTECGNLIRIVEAYCGYFNMEHCKEDGEAELASFLKGDKE